MVLREFQDGGRMKLDSRAKRWKIKGKSIDWYHFWFPLNLAGQSLYIQIPLKFFVI